MSAPLVVNTEDGTCWTRREETRGGQALYAPEKCGKCPEFVMATYAELEGHGIAGSADALPMPVGPEMPEFPPPPETELEKLRAERARLQGLLAEAVADVHRARRERDLMRERVSEPFGCKHCGEAKRSHGRRYVLSAGVHAWERPSDEQVKDRMLARRVARMALPSNLSLWEEGQENGRLRARVAELEHTVQQMCDALNGHDCPPPDESPMQTVTRVAVRLMEAERQVAELEAAPRQVFRASHDSIVMGLYTSREAAMDHVHAVLANEEGGDVTARVIWRADDPEADEPAWECWLFDSDVADDSPTGYVVTPLEVASEYDPDGDE